VKKKVEQTPKINSVNASKVSTGQALKERADQTYLHVNQISFHQNFKALIGHYKTINASRPVPQPGL